MKAFCNIFLFSLDGELECTFKNYSLSHTTNKTMITIHLHAYK